MIDLPRDGHLQAALRHAPDAQATPPAHLSAQILAAAHRAASEAPRRERRPGLFGTPWRLGASGAFATVALAGVLGLLWRGDQPGPASEPPTDVPAAAPAAVAPPSADDAAQARASQAREAASRDMASRERARDEATARMQAEQRAVAERKTEAPPAKPAPAPVQAPLAQTDATPVVAAAAPPPPPPPAPAPAAAPVAAAAARAAAPALSMAPRPAAPWLAAEAPLQWQLDGQPWVASENWLATLAAQAHGRWQPAPGATPAADDLRLEWAGPAGTLGRLWLGDRRLLSCDAAGRCEAAALDAEAAATLRRTLPR